MAAAVIAVGFAYVGSAAAAGASTTIGAIFVSAVIGGIVGYASAEANGQDGMKGAIAGAVVGGVAGGISGMVKQGVAAQQAGAASSTAADTSLNLGSGASGAGSTETLNALNAGTATASAPVAQQGPTIAAAQNLNQQPAAPLATSATPPPAQPAAQPGAAATLPQTDQGKGLLSRFGSWVERNPNQATIISQGIGGVAQGLLQSQANEDQIKAQKDLLKMQIESQKVTGLDKLDTMSILPSIGEFTNRPKWEMEAMNA